MAYHNDHTVKPASKQQKLIAKYASLFFSIIFQTINDTLCVSAYKALHIMNSCDFKTTTENDVRNT